MINKIDFKAKNLTSNAGLFLLLEQAGDAGDEGGHIDLGEGVLIRGMLHGKASF